MYYCIGYSKGSVLKDCLNIHLFYLFIHYVVVLKEYHLWRPSDGETLKVQGLLGGGIRRLCKLVMGIKSTRWILGMCGEYSSHIQVRRNRASYELKVQICQTCGKEWEKSLAVLLQVINTVICCRCLTVSLTIYNTQLCVEEKFLQLRIIQFSFL